MKSNNLKTFLITCTFYVLSFTMPAQAGIFKILLNAGQEAAEVGGKVGKKLDVDGGLPGLSFLPNEVGVSKVGLDVDSKGNLSLLSENGQKWPFNEGDDLAKLTADIKKSQNLSSGTKTKELKFYLTSNELFGSLDNPMLKKMDNLNLTHQGKVYPLKRSTNRTKDVWQINARDNLFVDVTSYSELKTSLFRVNKSINLANMRLVSFSTNTEGFPSKIQVASKDTLPELTMLHPDFLETNLNILKHQSLVITGKRVGDTLKVKGPKGKESSINIKQLQNEANKNDVNLLIIETASSAQPGSKILPWNKSAKQKQLQDAFSSETYGDFLNAFSSEKKPISLLSGKTENNFVSFQALPKKVKATVDSAPEVKLGIEVATHITLHAARLYTRSEQREEELERRIIPGVPSWIHIFLFLNIISGIVVNAFSFFQWQRIWKKEQRDDFDNWFKYALHRFAYYFSYLFIFLALIGSLLLIVRVIIWIYNFIINVFKVLTWPLRFVYGLVRGASER